MNTPMHSTLLSKIWQQHLVTPQTPETPAVLYIDLHLLHEVTSPQAFQVLKERGLKVRRPERTLATMDHSTPTTAPLADGRTLITDPIAKAQLELLQQNCAQFGLRLLALNDPHNGIVHVVAPELGFTQPGMTIVCGDSHTATHGAFGALAFGIGTTEVGYVLATQTLPQREPQTLAVKVRGTLAKGVTAKDLILQIINKLGVGGGTGKVIEYQGRAITSLNMEERMTVCNMSIEAGARAGMIAPDDTTFSYLEKAFKQRAQDPTWNIPFTAEDFAKKVAHWQTLKSDPEARFTQTLELDATELTPMITYGTDPSTGIPIDGVIPATAPLEMLTYMGFQRGERLLGKPVNVVFIGSCTNSRISDLRLAAQIFKHKKVAPGVRVLVVPGSHKVKQQAEAEGLAEIFKNAGALWREPGCSMCIAMNGDFAHPGEYVVSTSNRNFKGRQGPGSRTLLASPLVAAAAAVHGCISDPRQEL